MSIDLKNLRELFLKGWSKETCYPKSKDKWTPENPTFGQCAVTALVINDLFGGEIVSNPKYHHYFNILEDGTEIDLTREQWKDVVIEGHEPSTRDYILFSERGRDVQTLERYQLLRKNVERELLHIDYAPETVEEAYEYLDKFLQDKDVFKNVSDKEVTGAAHHTLGRWLRNQWYLWWSEDYAKEAIEKKVSYYPQTIPGLKKYFQSLGINHPDDMTGIVIQSYHRRLNNRPIDLENQINKTKEFYKV